MDAPPALPVFDPPYAPDDAALIRRFIAETATDNLAELRIDTRARRYIAAIRGHSGLIGGLDDFLREFGLLTPEGLALMVLAEALLRVPDAATQDRLIEDKLGGGDWREHSAAADTWFVLASTWALGLSSRIVDPGTSPDGLIAGLVRRAGRPCGPRRSGRCASSATTSSSARRSPTRSAGRGRARRAASGIPTTCWAKGRGRGPMPSATSPPTPRLSRPSARRRATAHCPTGRAYR